jgi:hypothetical protein
MAELVETCNLSDPSQSGWASIWFDPADHGNVCHRVSYERGFD